MSWISGGSNLQGAQQILNCQQTSDVMGEPLNIRWYVSTKILPVEIQGGDFKYNQGKAHSELYRPLKLILF